MSTPNVALLRQTMDAILANPEMHNQEAWASRTDCGTAYCFAGMTCHLSGFEPDFDQHGYRRHDEVRSSELTDGRSIDEAAVDLLGLDGETAAVLFDGTNTVADLKHMVDEIAAVGRLSMARGRP